MSVNIKFILPKFFDNKGRFYSFLVVVETRDFFNLTKYVKSDMFPWCLLLPLSLLRFKYYFRKRHPTFVLFLRLAVDHNFDL